MTKNKLYTAVDVLFYSNQYVKTYEVKEFAFNIWKILSKISYRFNVYSSINMPAVTKKANSFS